MKVGDQLTVCRVFTNAEVAAFGAMTLDLAPWHVSPDARGRLVVHGLLSTSLCTAIGGALGFLARRFDLEMLAPVFTGEAVTCTFTVTELSEASSPGAARLGQTADSVTRCEGTAELTNEQGQLVVRVKTRGVIAKPLAQVLAESLADTQAMLSEAVTPLTRSKL